MGLADGDAFVSGSILSYQQAERIRDNWRAAAAPTNPQPGALWSDSGNEKLSHRQASAWMEILQADNFYLSTAAAGGYALRIDAYQDDVTALTGLLRGAYIQASNGDIAATGTIRALELKARAGRPGEVGNNVAVLEGLSISADAKTYDITTVMRGAEVILDGADGSTITKAVGLRIAQNFQADIATLCYGLEFYRDSFDFDADIALSKGATIESILDGFRLNGTGASIIELDDGTYRNIIQTSRAEGLVGADLRIGLDETNRTLIICDRGDIATDFGLAAQTDPSLVIFDATGTLALSAKFGRHTILPLENDAVTPTLAFGDGDTGFYESADDTITFSRAGIATWKIATRLTSVNAYRAGLVGDANASDIQPTLLPANGDADTGIGALPATADILCLIAGGVEGIRLTESTGVLQTHQLTAGITAHVGSAQGDGVLYSSFNEISICANPGDAVTLPSASAGKKVTIINNGANAVDVFPASGDDCGGGVNAAVSLAAGANITYLAFNTVTWAVI